VGLDGKPSAEPAARYFLKKFVELNQVYAEELERLQPALWNVIEAALKGETSATIAQTVLMTTLGEQYKYNIKSFRRFCATKLLVLLFTEQTIQVFGALCL